MDEIGIWPPFTGRGMHDRFASYAGYNCAHSLCGAHLGRDCAGVAEQEQQQWVARCRTSCWLLTNDQAQRDLRWAKVQQKIAAPFRSATGATTFCRIRSYLSTMRKQGHAMLAALAAVFAGQPFPVAWGS